jgi:hypothetical protein
MTTKKSAPTQEKKGLPENGKLLSRADAAKLLGVTYQRICQLHRQGRLVPVNAGESSARIQGFLYRRSDVERLRDVRLGAHGSTAAAAFEIFENGGNAVDVVKALHVSPDNAMSLLKAYTTASHSALVSRSTLEEIKKLGFAVTPETLNETLGRMLATYRAAASILRKNGLGAQLDALLNATKISSE